MTVSHRVRARRSTAASHEHDARDGRRTHAGDTRAARRSRSPMVPRAYLRYGPGGRPYRPCRAGVRTRPRSASPERTMERTSVPYRTRERNSRNEGRAKQSVARRARRELPVPPYGCSPDDGREIGMRGCGWMIARRLDLIARRAERRSSPSSSPSQCLSVTATQRTRLSGFSTCMIMTSWS